MKSYTRFVHIRNLPRWMIHIKRYLFNPKMMLNRILTQRIFRSSSDSPSYLDTCLLEPLQASYPFPPEYGYDANSLEIRGVNRAMQILKLPGARNAQSFLELGCWDGMVSCSLQKKSKQTTAIDFRNTGFDNRAFNAGVKLMQMHAEELQFENEKFDFVFSYDAFEHFSNPEKVLNEAIRVTKTGGYIFLEYGPLYYSAFGEHANRTITIPYCQFLFQKEDLNSFAASKKFDLLDFNHVNGWSVERYRILWNKVSNVLNKIVYNEYWDMSHLNLIKTYPSCFKSKSSYFDNFVVSSIRVLFQKTGAKIEN